MTESIQKQCNVSENKYIYSIFSKLELFPHLIRSQTLYPAELRAHLNMTGSQENQYSGLEFFFQYASPLGTMFTTAIICSSWSKAKITL